MGALIQLVSPLVIGIIIAFAIIVIAGAIVRRDVDKRIRLASNEANRIRLEAENRQKELILEAKDEALRVRTALEAENRERRAEVQQSARNVQKKEEAVERSREQIEKREKSLQSKEKDLDVAHEELQALKAQQNVELQRVSRLDVESAKKLLLESIEQEVRDIAGRRIRDIEAEAREDGERRARDIIVTSIQRYAAEQAMESTVSVVPLPNEEMKARIIGREGRNIRALENETGVDLIIDDTPEAVTLSGLDPVRREVARVALFKLIQDGRITPSRIEELVAKARHEVEQIIRDEGEKAVIAANVTGLHPELVKTLGRLHYRTSYGQNVLSHSVEVAYLAAMLAAEVGADVSIARRGGLLHDIGKALDHEIEGPHAEIGAQLCKRLGVNPKVVHCVAEHHNRERMETVEAMLVEAADAISAARPGARGDMLASYTKRLEALEQIATSFPGVDRAFAIQAGREVRIIVRPDDIDELATVRLSRDIVKKIEDSLEYPGQIKVMVIRETRVVDYAK
jgi:ribonuclease Y